MTFFRRTLPHLLICGLYACGSSASTGSDGDGGVRDAPDAPRIVSLSTSSDSLSEDGTITISVIATDPDGVSDLIGGAILDANGRNLATLSSQADEGAYSADIEWSRIVGSYDASGKASGAQETVFVELYDQAGHQVRQGVDFTLACGANNNWVCEGTCVDLESDRDHCGQCGAAIAPAFELCSSGAVACAPGTTKCPDWDSCGYTDTINDCGVCGYSCPVSAVGASLCASGPTCIFNVVSSERISCASVCENAGAHCNNTWHYALYEGASVVPGNPPVTLLPSGNFEKLSCGMTPSAEHDEGAFEQIACTCDDAL